MTPTPAEIVARSMGGPSGASYFKGEAAEAISALHRAGFVVVPRADVEEAARLIHEYGDELEGEWSATKAMEKCHAFAATLRAHLKSEPQT